jgi:hypothetical protein
LILFELLCRVLHRLWVVRAVVVAVEEVVVVVLLVEGL